MQSKTLVRKIGALASWFGPSLLVFDAENTFGSRVIFQNPPAPQTAYATQGNAGNLIGSVPETSGNFNGAGSNNGRSVHGVTSSEDLDFLTHYLLESHPLIRQKILALDIFGGTQVETLELPLTLDLLEQELMVTLRHSSQNERQCIHKLFEAKRNELSEKKACLKWILDDYRGLKLNQMTQAALESIC